MDTFKLACIVLALLGANALAAPFDNLWNWKRTLDQDGAPSQRCTALQYAVETVMDDFLWIMDEASVTQEYQELIKPEFELGGETNMKEKLDEAKEQIRPILCVIADAESLNDIAKSLGAPLGMITHMYQDIKRYFSDLGVSPSQLLIENEVLSYIIWRQFQAVGFPQWPLQVSKEDILGFMEQMSVYYGDKWISYLHPVLIRNPADIDLEGIAEALAGAASSSEAAEAILSGPMPAMFKRIPFLVLEIMSNNQEFRNIMQKTYQDAGHVAVLVESYGLMDLDKN